MGIFKQPLSDFRLTISQNPIFDILFAVESQITSTGDHGLYHWRRVHLAESCVLFFFKSENICRTDNKDKWEAQDSMYLQTASLDRIEHKKFLQQVFTVCGHVERNTVLSS